MATNLKEDKVMMGFSVAFIIIVLIVLYSLARTAGESDRILESIRAVSYTHLGSNITIYSKQRFQEGTGLV